ncbi:hypothetical protein HAX54_038196 [Datura stramonium]|uniref:Uncharacterized protein n=1 Tax=Datura stramonium TaxID=4076 RepID=A0ABS8RNB1_DATST|nr:hypothetical protein [Datura stramonium]
MLIGVSEKRRFIKRKPQDMEHITFRLKVEYILGESIRHEEEIEGKEEHYLNWAGLQVDDDDVKAVIKLGRGDDENGGVT